MWTEQQDIDGDYGQWEYSIQGALAEERRLNPPKKPEAHWPHWRTGVPNLLSETTETVPFSRERVTYRSFPTISELALNWERPRKIAELRKNRSLLPPLHRSSWRGVYRIFIEGRDIGRLLGTDPTGTLYLGMAGTGSASWSILRTRMMSASNRNNHVTIRWWYDENFEKALPWGTVLVQWAYTPDFIDYRAETLSGPRRAERWLLRSYRDSFGEYPPLNEKG